jgi:hypothetical protein
LFYPTHTHPPPQLFKGRLPRLGEDGGSWVWPEAVSVLFWIAASQLPQPQNDRYRFGRLPTANDKKKNAKSVRHWRCELHSSPPERARHISKCVNGIICHYRNLKKKKYCLTQTPAKCRVRNEALNSVRAIAHLNKQTKKRSYDDTPVLALVVKINSWTVWLDFASGQQKYVDTMSRQPVSNGKPVQSEINTKKTTHSYNVGVRNVWSSATTILPACIFTAMCKAQTHVPTGCPQLPVALWQSTVGKAWTWNKGTARTSPPSCSSQQLQTTKPI